MAPANWGLSDGMKNIQVIEGAENCVYDIFAATDEEFAVIFPSGEDIAFINEVCNRVAAEVLDPVLSNLWKRRLKKSEVMGIHGTLFYELDSKAKYYPSRRDDEACNPDGARLRW